MFESANGLQRPRQSGWFAVLAVALCLTAAVLLSACGDEPQSGSPTRPAVTPTTTSGSTPIPTDGPPFATPGRPAAQEPSSEIRSDRERAAPSAGNADLAGLINANSAFSFDLFHALRERDGNLFYSPHSISLALSMTYAGAGGRTASQMADTLRFSLPQDRLHPAFNALSHELASRTGAAWTRTMKGPSPAVMPTCPRPWNASSDSG